MRWTLFRLITSVDVNFVLGQVFHCTMNHKLGQRNTGSYFHHCNILQLPCFQSEETCSHPMLGHSMPVVLGRVFHCGVKESQTRTTEHKLLFPPLQYFTTVMLPVRGNRNVQLGHSMPVQTDRDSICLCSPAKASDHVGHFWRSDKKQLVTLKVTKNQEHFCVLQLSGLTDMYRVGKMRIV